MNQVNIIKTSHELNHFRGGYTRLELDFIYAFISTIRDEDEEFRVYRLTLHELEEKLGRRLKLQDVEYLFESLIKKSFKVHNEVELVVYSFFTTIRFDKELRELSVKFNPDLKLHLLKLKTYALGNFRYILQFNSEYSKRLYMLSCQWVQAKFPPVYSIEELRDILNIPKSYKYGQFKQKVLVKAEKELINKKSDIYFEFEEIKTGRKVTAIKIRAKRMPKSEYTAPEGNASEFTGAVIYWNGFDYKISSAVVNEDGSIHAVLLGEDGGLRAENFTKDQLIKMVDAKK